MSNKEPEQGLPNIPSRSATLAPPPQSVTEVSRRTRHGAIAVGGRIEDAPSMPIIADAASHQQDLEDLAAAADRVRMLRGEGRRPFGAFDQKLAYPKRAGYFRHWFNDEPGRVQQAKGAGYEQVIGIDGQPVTRPVGTAKRGGVLMAYLMEIPEELWREDIGRTDARNDRVEDEIMRGIPKAADGETLKGREAKGFYQPTGMTTIKTGLSKS